ncbi:MAG: ATP-binding cassette domain-containing protein [Planctomycetota bacterium]
MNEASHDSVEVDQLDSSCPLLDIRDVTICFDGVLVLDRLSLSIGQGQHTAVLGANGSGKTSLLKLLTRELYPSVTQDGRQGQVKILDRSDWEVAQLRRQMGMVTSGMDHRFTRGRSGRMTAPQVIASGFTATELNEFGPVVTPKMQRRIDHLVGQLGIGGYADRPIATLSTGERRRVLIARALVHRPAILVLDEPTSGLDLVAQHHLMSSIGELLASPGLTVVLVTHHVEEVMPGFRSVCLLRRGRVFAKGSRKECLTSDKLTELYGHPVAVDTDANGRLSARTAGWHR